MIIKAEDIREIIEEADIIEDIAVLDNDASLPEQGVDSLDMSNIYLLIEEKFGVHLPDEDLDQLLSINDIVKYLENK